MKKIKMTYPVITFNTIIIKVSDEKAEEIQNYNDDQKADLMFNHNYEQDIPDHVDIFMIKAALDTDHATVKIINE